MKSYNFIVSSLFLFILTGCKNDANKKESPENNSVKGDIVSTIINDTDNFYHINFKDYPSTDKSLPIGVFDSGTGGLTVLKAIVNYDENNNNSVSTGSDGALDFEKESFIYLGDQANMPYGNYSAVNKVDLLKEHIIKDAQFLMSNKYYSDALDTSVNTDKKPVKALVIACNTATAYGKEYIEEFIKKANSNIKVIGVIDAGVRGTLESIKKDEDAIIGVLATAGTVASKGYHNTIIKFKNELNYTGDIDVFSQGGIGIAEAVDEDPNYFNKNLKKPRKDYKGPSLNGSVKIDKTLFDIYNFDFDDSKMLCDTEKADDCSMLQINDAENYVRYHLVTLMEQIRKSETTNNNADKGKHGVEQTIRQITNLSEKLLDSESVVKELEKESVTIGSVLGVIRGIAEQTNLLALNAAIEAARAGEQGRGFAVVADEVRSLASRTGDSTQEIQQMIERLQKNAEQAVSVMNKSKQQAEESVEDASRAGNALETIADAVNTINDMAAQIATAAEEQTTVNAEINRNVVNIVDLSKETANEAEQSNQASMDLANLANMLNQQVEQFKV